MWQLGVRCAELEGVVVGDKEGGAKYGSTKKQVPTVTWPNQYVSSLANRPPHRTREWVEFKCA